MPTDSREQNGDLFRGRWYDALLPGFLVATLLFVFTPGFIYWGNESNFRLAFELVFWRVLPLWLIAILGSAALFSVAYKIRSERSLAAGYLVFVLLWVSRSFFYGNYEIFSGGTLEIEYLSMTVVIEVILWLLAGVFVYRGCYLQTLRQTAIIIGLLVSAMFAANYWSYLNSASYEGKVFNEEQASVLYAGELPRFSLKENIIHIVLDALQSDVVEEILLEDESLRLDFQGFTYFRDVAANFSITHLAIPAMLSGDAFDNKAKKSDYLSAALSEPYLEKALHGQGYRFDYHTMSEFCQEGRLQNCKTIPFAAPGDTPLMLLDYALFAHVPAVLKPLVYNDGKWIYRRWLGDVRRGSMGGIGYLLFELFRKNISVADDKPRYKFIHSLVSHNPIHLDANCEAHAAAAPIEFVYGKGQAHCALRATAQLLRKLRELGIYDNTVVVISSDHGNRFVPDSEQSLLAQKLIRPVTLPRAMAVMLVKPASATAHMAYSDKPVQLTDVPRFIEQLAGGMSEAEWRELVEGLKDERERVFSFLMHRSTTQESDFIDDMKSYRIVGKVSSISSWHLDRLSTRDQLHCSERVYFNNPDHFRKLESESISQVRGVGRWTNADRAALFFDFDASGCDDFAGEKLLSIKLSAFVNDQNPLVKAVVFVNNTEVGQLAFDPEHRSQEVKLAVPNSLLKEKEPNQLVFEIEGAVSPAALGISENDRRQLGLRLMEMEIN
jgi:hypothetical protein